MGAWGYRYDESDQALDEIAEMCSLLVAHVVHYHEKTKSYYENNREPGEFDGMDYLTLKGMLYAVYAMMKGLDFVEGDPVEQLNIATSYLMQDYLIKAAAEDTQNPAEFEHVTRGELSEVYGWLQSQKINLGVIVTDPEGFKYDNDLLALIYDGIYPEQEQDENQSDGQ